MDNQVTVTHTTNYQLEQAGSMMDLATNLAQFIKDRKLSQSIQGREYVLVEGWQYCGGMLGVLPIITGTENLSTAEEIIYTAKCDLINIKTGVKVGGAESVCSNKEKGKKFFEAYAIQSMAQTRCIGKAYRLMIGWLMKAAGYEATPAEEMDSVKEQENEIKAAAIEYLQSESREEALKVWNKYPQYKANPIFIKAAKALGALYPKHEETVAEEVKEPVEAPEEPAQPIPMIQPAQQEELLKLINNPLFSQKEKDNLVASISKLTEAEAAQEIEKLNNKICATENTRFASDKQKERIILLLNNPVITKQEKTKMLLNINKLDEKRAAEAIEKLEKVIEEREDGQASAA